MRIEVATTPAIDVYQMLIDVITPRPIAWVTSTDREGRVNLAPFSFFNVFGASPPADGWRLLLPDHRPLRARPAPVS